MLFLEYPPCTTCKKAKKWLTDHELDFKARHIKEQNPTAAELSDWQLDTISLNTVYAKSVRVQTEKGHKVSINGVALEDDHIIQISTTLAGNYLPEGVHGPTTCIYQLALLSQRKLSAEELKAFLSNSYGLLEQL